MNRNYNPFIKYALLISLSFLCSTNQVYSQTNSEDSYDLDSAIKNHNKVFSEKNDSNSSIILNKIEPWTFSGIVINVVDENNIVVKHNGREIMLKFINNEASGFKIGDKVSVTCIPYRENPNKVILAKGMKIGKADGQINSQTNSDNSSVLKSFESKNNNEPAKGKHITEIIGIIKDIPNEKKIVVRNDEGKEVTFYFKENLINDDFKIGDRVSVKFPLESFRQEFNMSGGTPVSLSATGMHIEKKDSDNNSQTNSENLQKRESLQKESRKRKSFETEVRRPSSLTGLKMNKPCTISGDITEIISDNNIIIKYEGREILVKFREKVAPDLEVGDKVTVTCTPYRENPNGVILSNGTALEKQE